MGRTKSESDLAVKSSKRTPVKPFLPRRFGENWWAKRWLNMIESFGWQGRLRGGKQFASEGNVIDISILPGNVHAQVQGKYPYQVEIQIKTLPKSAWENVTQKMASQAVFAAKLLVGEMPEDIERAFQATQLSLFPKSKRDMKSTCSCPDWAAHHHVCKHIAAVYYTLSSTFDHNPFLLFELRGLDKTELIESLRMKRASGTKPATLKTKTKAGGNGASTKAKAEKRGEDLSTDFTAFWQTGKNLDDFHVHIESPFVPQAILKCLGNLPSSTPEFLQHLKRAYETISHQAIQMAFETETETEM